ncbi:MAG: MarR family transcriptional regulator [Caulobacteraceae bacterium]
MQEKHEGGLSSALSVRVWLRLLTCVDGDRKRLQRRFAEQFNATLPRFDVLAALERRPEGLTMGELSRALLVSNGNVTALVRQLHEQGLVRSDEAPGDRRSSIVRLTPEGERQFAAMAAAHHAWIKAMLAGFPAEQQKQLFLTCWPV